MNEFNICETYETLKLISLLHIYSSTNGKIKINQTCKIKLNYNTVIYPDTLFQQVKSMSCAVIIDIVHRSSAFLTLLGLLTSLLLSGSVLCGFIIRIYDVQPTWSAVFPGDKCHADRHHSDCYRKNLLQGCQFWKSKQKTTSPRRDTFEKNLGQLVELMMTNLLRSFNQPIQTKTNDIIYSFLHVFMNNL